MIGLSGKKEYEVEEPVRMSNTKGLSGSATILGKEKRTTQLRPQELRPKDLGLPKGHLFSGVNPTSVIGKHLALLLL